MTAHQSRQMQTCELSVIVPAYQEGPHLRASLLTILQHVEIATADYELIVVDDGSTDETWETLTALHSANPRVHALRLSRNFGKEYAIAAGLDASRGQAAILLDADLQHPPGLIGTFFRLWKGGGAQVVEGIKVRRQDEPKVRRILSQLFDSFATLITGIDLQGSTDFKLLDRQVIDAWAALPERRCYFRGMSAWLGFTRVQVEFSVDPRGHGSSRWSAVQLVRLATWALTAFSGVPLRVIHVSALCFFLFSALLTWRALYLKFTGQAMGGATTVIIVQLIVGGMLLVSLGIIAEYLAAVYEEVKQRPRYLVRDSL